MDKDKAQKAVDKLIKLTKSKQLLWEEAVNPQRLEMTATVNQAFTAQFDGKTLAVCEYHYKDVDEFEVPTWNSEVSISITDNFLKPILPFPRVIGRWELFEIVRDQVLGADDILDSILKK
ncbi:MAG: hypothetical protein AABY53_01070 [Bdellovibrionota bacterium]|mgnify:FL=1